MGFIRNRRIWSAGYLSIIGGFCYVYMGLRNYEPWRCYKSANVKRF